MIIRKSAAELEQMAKAGRVVEEALALVGEHARIGVTTAELTRSPRTSSGRREACRASSATAVTRLRSARRRTR